jgi:O-antigen ligase
MTVILIPMLKRIDLSKLSNWFPWLIYIIISFLLSGHENSLQRTVILITPIAVGFVAANLNWDTKDLLLIKKAIYYFAAAFVILIIAKLTLFERDLYRLATPSITAVLFLWLTFIDYKLNRSLKSLLFSIILILVPVLSVSRMAIISGVLSLCVLSKKIFSIRTVLILLLLIVTFVGLAQIPAIQNKIYYATLKDRADKNEYETINTSGRLYMWGILVNGIKDSPIFGHGANASEELLKPISEHFTHPHNEFLRILYDYGLVGMILFVYAFLKQILKLKNIKNRNGNEINKYYLYCSMWLFFPFFTFMLTDNILLYSAYFLNIHFLFVGITEKVNGQS